jgi:hypothetical protein
MSLDIWACSQWKIPIDYQRPPPNENALGHYFKKTNELRYESITDESTLVEDPTKTA